MMRLFSRFARDRRGASAIEFALAGSVMLGVLLAIVEVWTFAQDATEMRTSLKAGVRYYMQGGADDASARGLAITAWNGRPDDGEVSVTRACRCGTSALDCSNLCPSDLPPATYVTLTATTRIEGMLAQPQFKQTQVVRVR